VGQDSEPLGGTAPQRAGTGRVIGTMGAIALVAVTIVVVSARVGGNSAAESDVEEAVPTTLAGGIPPGPVPDEVTAAFDAPVIAAVHMDNPPPDAVASCGESMGIIWDDGQPEVEHAVATPDGIYLSLLGTGDAGPDMGMEADAQKFRTTCSAQSDGGGWSSQGGGMEVVTDDGDLGDGFSGSSYTCCDDRGLATASGSVDVPEDAQWAVQDRNGWYLAYPTGERPRLMLTWKFRESGFGGGGSPPQSRVTFLDANGAVVGEDFADGRF
jgi:hypothetical protein